jgi:hypothetical protein
MQEITMLTPYLLTKFHNFSVYLISGTWSTIWNFLRNLMGKFINVRVTMGVHWPGMLCKTKPQSGGPKRWSTDLTLVGRPHFGTNLAGHWRLRLLEGGRGHADSTMSVWPKFMARRPHGGPCGRPTIFHHGNVAAKPGNRPWDTINTPLCATLQYRHSTVGSPLVKAPTL